MDTLPIELKRKILSYNRLPHPTAIMIMDAIYCSGTFRYFVVRRFHHADLYPKYYAYRIYLKGVD